jgi:hypothetical protein
VREFMCPVASPLRRLMRTVQAIGGAVGSYPRRGAWRSRPCLYYGGRGQVARTPALSSLEAIKAAAVMFSVHKITHSVLLSGEMPCRSTSRVVVSLQTLSRAC